MFLAMAAVCLGVVVVVVGGFGGCGMQGGWIDAVDGASDKPNCWGWMWKERACLWSERRGSFDPGAIDTLTLESGSTEGGTYPPP